MSSAAVLPVPETASALRRSKALAVGSALALVALLLAWELVLAPTGQRTLVIKLLPLLPALPGLLRSRLYTYRWTSLLVWLYAAEGCVRLSGERAPVPTLAALEIALSLMLFAGCAWQVRAQLRARKEAAQ